MPSRTRRWEELEQQQGRLLSMWLRGLMTDEGRYQAMEAKLAKEKQDLLLKAGACRDELGRMRANAEAGFRYLRSARNSFLVGDVRRRREIAKVLADEYVFFGREKRVEITLKPLLAEVVRYAERVGDALSPLAGSEALQEATEPTQDMACPKSEAGAKIPLKLAVFEPRKVGSGGGKSAEKMGAVLSGRRDETAFEPNLPLDPRAELMAALRDTVFPDVLGTTRS